jgi:hypothetical protein
LSENGPVKTVSPNTRPINHLLVPYADATPEALAYGLAK